MGFDEHFEHKRTYRKSDNYHERDHFSEYEYLPTHSGGMRMGHYGFYIVSKIWSNRKLRLLFIVVLLLLVIVLIILLKALIPFMIRIVDYISQTGLKGITEGVAAFIEKLWSGSGS
jgi:hypothetical protein